MLPPPQASSGLNRERALAILGQLVQAPLRIVLSL
jgi:hypothetical protein